MKTTISTNQAANILMQDMDANWSYRGSMALVEYLEELEDSTGEEIDFDHVAIRCDFSEYPSLQDWADDYGLDETEDDVIADYIRSNGELIEFDGGVIVSSF